VNVIFDPSFTRIAILHSAASVLHSFCGHSEYRLSIRQIGRVHQPSNALLSFGLPQIQPEGGGVSQHVPAHRLGWIIEEGIRLGHGLIGDPNRAYETEERSS